VYIRCLYLYLFLSQWASCLGIFFNVHISQKTKTLFLLSNIEYYNNNSNFQFIDFQYIENTLFQYIMSSCIISVSIMLCYHCESHGTYVVHMQGWNFFQNYMDKTNVTFATTTFASLWLISISC